MSVSEGSSIVPAAARQEPESLAAERLARLQEDFVAIVSHELRTPLTTMALALANLRRGWRTMPEERREQHLELLHEGLQRLRGLVDDLSTIAQIEEGRFPVELGPVPLMPLLQAAALEAAERYPGAVVEVRGGQHDVRAPIDPACLREILRRLLSNACRYGGEAPVTLSLRARAGRVQVVVRDRGPGVPPERRPDLFTRFARFSGSQSGLGLGLYLSRLLASAMGGSLTYRPARGGGAEFVVDLPQVEAGVL